MARLTIRVRDAPVRPHVSIVLNRALLHGVLEWSDDADAREVWALGLAGQVVFHSSSPRPKGTRRRHI
jgi:hypothetical protein